MLLLKSSEKIRMKIVIITRGREGAVHTLKSIPESWHHRTYICCPPEENHRWPARLMIYEPFPMNYSEKFNWLVNGGCEELGAQFLIMDDDLRFSMRSIGGASLVSATPAAISAGLGRLEDMLHKYPLVGLHPRAMGNNAAPGIKECTRINAMQGVNRDLIGPIKLDHWPILADMVLNLTLLTSGFKTAINCDLFWDQVGGSNAPGGCSLHRTKEQQREAVLGLAAMFPKFVTVVEKSGQKSGGGFWADRVDFRIQWKKAYESGSH